MVADTRAQMQKDMDNYISTQMEKDTNTSSLAQVTHAAQATLNHAYGGQDGKGDAQNMMTFLSRKGAYIRCCIS